MAKNRPAASGLIRVYARRLTFIEGVPHRDQDVTPDEAERLLAHMGGAAFTTDPADRERLYSDGPSAQVTDLPTAGDEPAQSED